MLLGEKEFWLFGFFGLFFDSFFELKEFLKSISRTGGTFFHFPGDVPHDPLADPGRKVGAKFFQGCHLVLEVAGHDLGSRLAIEGVEASEAKVVEASDGIHVGAHVERFALELFRSHEVDGSEDSVAVVDGLDRWLGVELGEPEVDELDLKLSAREPSDHDVGGLEVTVDEVEILRGDECFLCLDGDFAEVFKDERAFFDHFVDGPASEELHDDVGAFFIDACVEDGDDMRVLDGGERGCFLQEVFDGFFLAVVSSVGEDAFDGDFAVQALIPGPIHCTHATLAYLSSYFVSIFWHGDSVKM